MAKRYSNQPMKWGTKKVATSFSADEITVEAVQLRAEELTTEREANVSKSVVISEIIERDSHIKRLRKVAQKLTDKENQDERTEARSGSADCGDN